VIDFSLSLLLPGALILILLSLALYYIWAAMPRSGTVEWIHMREKRPFGFRGGRHKLTWRDAVAIGVIVILWGALSFFNLGDRTAPQTFHRFESNQHVVIDLGQPTNVGQVRYYTGLNTGEYVLEFSADGHVWRPQGDMPQRFSDLFKWLDAGVTDGFGVQFIRLSADRGPLYLGELAIYDQAGWLLDAGRFHLEWSSPVAASTYLFDEQSTIPAERTFLNSSYFDEIYHARTAYEHILQMEPYERSHPPLGKIIIGIGIQIFGMTPFGWRFMGALAGTVILALFYLLVKGMFGRQLVAVCATIVFASSFMHFAQTRIATIDTYAVLFVLLQFWFLYRYISLDYETPFKKTLLPLGLAGLFFGLGAAAKWTSLFFVPAMGILWLIYQVLRNRHWRKNEKPGAGKHTLYTILACFGFFVVIPGIVYYLSYIPYGQAEGVGLFSGEYFRIVIENQQFMFGYHSGERSEHGFASNWYQWVLNIRPILYYRGIRPGGMYALIAAFGNPAVYWGGLLAMFAMPVAAFRRGDGRALAILIGYVSLLLPWIFISRPTFAYHYFISIIFLCLALAYVFDHLMRRRRGMYQTVILSFTIGCALLFGLFYPVLSGHPVSEWYLQNVLRWFTSWPFAV